MRGRLGMPMRGVLSLILLVAAGGLTAIVGCAGGSPSFEGSAPSKETFILTVTVQRTNNGANSGQPQAANLTVTVLQ
jgi:hypothetical protein